MVERSLSMREVRGSIPCISKIFFLESKIKLFESKQIHVFFIRHIDWDAFFFSSYVLLIILYVLNIVFSVTIKIISSFIIKL